MFNLTNFLKGIDLTALPAINAGDWNNLVDAATLMNDRGIIIYSVDSAVNVPVVPDATAVGYEQFIRFIWLRIPHVNDGDRTPSIYGWNDAAESDATYLKWLQLTPDLSDLQDTINTALNNSITAIGAAQTANVNATNANSLSQQAATQASDAKTVASTAASNATAALTALNGQTNVSGAITSLQAAVASATGSAGAQKSPANALTPGTPGQHIRTNANANAAEWFSPEKQIVCLIDTSGGASTNGAYTRQFAVAYDSGNNVISNNAGSFVLAAGTYLVDIVTQCHGVNYNSRLTGSSTIWGTSCFSPAAVGEPCMLSSIKGVITTDGVQAWTIVAISNTVSAGGFGKATGIAGVTEVYGHATFIKLK